MSRRPGFNAGPPEPIERLVALLIVGGVLGGVVFLGLALWAR